MGLRTVGDRSPQSPPRLAEHGGSGNHEQPGDATLIGDLCRETEALVLAETVWVLVSVYERTPEHMVSAPALGFSDCLVLEIARKAGHVLALAPAARKNRALAAMAKALRRARPAILAANAEDLAAAKSAGVTAAFLDRLTLNAERIESMAAGLDAIGKLKDLGAVNWRGTIVRCARP